MYYESLTHEFKRLSQYIHVSVDKMFFLNVFFLWHQKTRVIPSPSYTVEVACPRYIGVRLEWFKRICSHYGNIYPAKPSYSHCVEPGRSDIHFSTAGCVKQTLIPPTDKAERSVGHMQLARSGDLSRTMPLKHGGLCGRALRCHQGREYIPLCKWLYGDLIILI